MYRIYDNVSSLTPFSLLDYPGRASCILWFGGCNLRCPYCHNSELVRGPFVRFGSKRIASFLESRRGLLEGVVLSGGESSLCPEIEGICSALKGMGFLVKMDSNGCRPETLRRLIEEGLIDYVGLDYKAPAEKFQATTGRDCFEAFSESLDLLIDSGLECEIRTTTHSDLLDERDVEKIIGDLECRGYRKKYYIQDFVDHGPERPALSCLPPHASLDRTRIRESDLLTVRYRNFD